MKIMLAAIVTVLAGCGTMNTGIVEIDDGVYMYAKQDMLAWSGGSVKVELFKESRDFCATKGKKFKLLNQQSQDYAAYSSSASAELQFRCE